MNFLGVHIDFNKHYTEVELAELEEQLEEATNRACRKMVYWTLVTCSLATTVVYIAVTLRR